ncbi:MAG: tetratricopeptide repeat protein [Ardenticatenaceae bacterium]
MSENVDWGAYARNRATRYFNLYLTYAYARKEPNLDNYEALEREFPNIMNTVDGLVGWEKWDAVRNLTWSVDDYLDIQGRWTERLTTLEAGLAAARALESRNDEGGFLNDLANAYSNLGRVTQATSYYQQALVIAQETGDRRGEGLYLANQGAAYHDLAQVKQAMDFYQQSLAIAREIGNRQGEGDIWNLLENVNLIKFIIFKNKLYFNFNFNKRSGHPTDTAFLLLSSPWRRFPHSSPSPRNCSISL